MKWYYRFRFWWWWLKTLISRNNWIWYIREINRRWSSGTCESLSNSITHSMKIECESFLYFMKSAEVTPVYKKENNLKRDNNRPLNILTVISKQYVCLQHAESGPFLCIVQWAIRKSYSCQTLLIKYIEDLKFALEKEQKSELSLWTYRKILIAYHMKYN